MEPTNLFQALAQEFRSAYHRHDCVRPEDDEKVANGFRLMAWPCAAAPNDPDATKPSEPKPKDVDGFVRVAITYLPYGKLRRPRLYEIFASNDTHRESFERLADRAGEALSAAICDELRKEIAPAFLIELDNVGRWLTFLWWQLPLDSNCVALGSTPQGVMTMPMGEFFRCSIEAIDRCGLQTDQPVFRSDTQWRRGHLGLLLHKNLPLLRREGCGDVEVDFTKRPNLWDMLCALEHSKNGLCSNDELEVFVSVKSVNPAAAIRTAVKDLNKLLVPLDVHVYVKRSVGRGLADGPLAG